jgi:DMSO/TMAO reductase YedYZ heme-binding membrane subunit
MNIEFLTFLTFLIIGFIVIWILIAIAIGSNQKVIYKNQVQQSKLLQEIIYKISKK